LDKPGKWKPCPKLPKRFEQRLATFIALGEWWLFANLYLATGVIYKITVNCRLFSLQIKVYTARQVTFILTLGVG